MFKNKHLIIAMLVAPILAILAWFGTDAIVADKPFEAEAGGNYRLAEKPNCRWESGECGLKNGEFELLFYAKPLAEGQKGARVEWQLEASHALSGVQFAVVDGDENIEPDAMQADDAAGQKWWLHTDAPQSENATLRLVAKADGAIYYGEAGTTFLKGERKQRSR